MTVVLGADDGRTWSSASDASLSLLGWRPHRRVRALITGRRGGVSAGRWRGSVGLAEAADGLNLGDHVGDDPAAVVQNRRRLLAHLPSAPVWLNQVHGVDVWIDSASEARPPKPPTADAAVTALPGNVLAVLTADCLPVLLASADGSAVGVAHAGWRGLCAGVLERTVDALRAKSAAAAPLAAYLGPGIGPAAFEVGEEVRDAFCRADPGAEQAFRHGAKPGKWLADLAALARRRLAAVGVHDVQADGRCTVGAVDDLYSYRRDGITGRMASLIWIVDRDDPTEERAT